MLMETSAGRCTFPIESVDDNGTKQDDRVSGLYPAKGANWRTMMGRLGRAEPGKSALEKIPTT